MRKIGNQKFVIKDYYCDNGNGYLPKSDGKLWLYVNISNFCNASCPFCINNNSPDGKFDLISFENTVFKIKNFINGVSITGGEPMLEIKKVDEVINLIYGIFGTSLEIDMVTNGTFFTKLPELMNFAKLDSVHLSRHMISDYENDRIFRCKMITAKEIAETLRQIDDPAKVVFNCVLMSEGIHNINTVADYLEFAASLGIRNTCFIGLSKCNKFCATHYVDPRGLNFSEDSRFHIWNHYSDHEYCSCSSGSYDALETSVRFYYRVVGEKKVPYARQLVYTADNRLLAGFGGKEIEGI